MLASILNIVSMIVSAAWGTSLYIKSVSPAALEKTMGRFSYDTCSKYRQYASYVSSITVINYLMYSSYPLPLPIPLALPWDWLYSFIISIVLLIPGLYFFIRGRRDVGRESIVPKKYHKLVVNGIYKNVRHPQSVGEIFFWFVLAFICHSPFLVIITFLWIPIYSLWCRAEEKDLILRFGDEYTEYMKNSGFFIPKISKR